MIKDDSSYCIFEIFQISISQKKNIKSQYNLIPSSYIQSLLIFQKYVYSKTLKIIYNQQQQISYSLLIISLYLIKTPEKITIPYFNIIFTDQFLNLQFNPMMKCGKKWKAERNGKLKEYSKPKLYSISQFLQLVNNTNQFLIHNLCLGLCQEILKPKPFTIRNIYAFYNCFKYCSFVVHSQSITFTFLHYINNFIFIIIIFNNFKNKNQTYRTMVKQKRYCLFENHNQNLVEYVCIEKQCNNISRWHCVECSENNVHQHGMQNDQHIIGIQSLIMRLESEGKNLEDQIIEQSNLQQKFISIINEIKKNLDQLIQVAKDWEEEIQDSHNLIELNTFINNLKVNQQSIDDETLIKLSLFKSDESKYTQWQIILEDLQFTIKQQQIQIERLKYYQENNYQKYIINQYTQSFIQADGFLEHINTACISNDEQYLAYGGNGWKMYIYDINGQKKVNELEMKVIITSSQFSLDSQYLVIGDADGNLYCFSTKNEFKQSYLAKIHTSSINQIHFKSHNILLTCSYDQTIIETDIVNQKQILRIHDAHKNQINTLAFDKTYNFIISGSSDKCIKFFNSDGKQIISKQDAHQFQISQIQLIEQLQKMISLDIQGNLKMWLVNYQNMTLWETNSFSEQETIYNFLSFRNDQYLLHIYNNYIKILDDLGNRKRIIKYEGDISNSTRNIQQLESLNQIMVYYYQPEKNEDDLIIVTHNV
ncbi:hypothetical protein pb186bvf_002622 [Paramecium bursaria]